MMSIGDQQRAAPEVVESTDSGRASRRPQIRRATPDDARRLLPLFSEHAAYEGAAAPTAIAEYLHGALQGAQPRLLVWVAEIDGHTVGYVSGSVSYCTWTSSIYFLMDCLFVVEAHRGSGLGKALMQVMCSHAVELGCLRVEWLTPTWNQQAIRFYESGGAAPQDRVRFRLPLGN